MWGYSDVCQQVSDTVLGFLPRYEKLLFVILYFPLIWLKSTFLASDHTSPHGWLEVFLCTSGRPQCTEKKSLSRYLLEHPAAGKNGRTGLEHYFLRPVLGSAFPFVTV